MTTLAWSPIYHVLEEKIRTGDDLILLIVPFIKVEALRRLYEIHRNKVKIKVICRWRPEDIISGASDLEVYSYLKDIGSSLYINPNIHLKIYIFNSNVTFNTSGNLTLQGLGYSEKANIEVGNFVFLTEEDWIKIYRIIGISYSVDDTLYSRYKAFLEQQPKIQMPTYTPDLLPTPKKYTISSLPATENLVTLSNYYFNKISEKVSPDQVRRAMHDLVIFNIPQGLNESDYEQAIKDNFCNSPFVTDFVALIKQEKSLRFGAVNDWIHQKCEDVPLPYKWEIKENTHIFYDWLEHFIPEITWDRPNYSQVIYWKEN